MLDLGKTRQLVKQLEKRLGCELDGALALMEAGLAHQPPKYDLLQEVNLANEGQYRGVVNGFAKTAKQSKTQVGGWYKGVITVNFADCVVSHLMLGHHLTSSSTL